MTVKQELPEDPAPKKDSGPVEFEYPFTHRLWILFCNMTVMIFVALAAIFYSLGLIAYAVVVTPFVAMFGDHSLLSTYALTTAHVTEAFRMCVEFLMEVDYHTANAIRARHAVPHEDGEYGYHKKTGDDDEQWKKDHDDLYGRGS